MSFVLSYTSNVWQLPFITILKYKRPTLAVLSLSMMTVKAGSGYEWDWKMKTINGNGRCAWYCTVLFILPGIVRNVRLEGITAHYMRLFYQVQCITRNGSLSPRLLKFFRLGTCLTKLLNGGSLVCHAEIGNWCLEIGQIYNFEQIPSVFNKKHSTGNMPCTGVSNNMGNSETLEGRT
jgi:hypothetical protein